MLDLNIATAAGLLEFLKSRNPGNWAYLDHIPIRAESYCMTPHHCGKCMSQRNHFVWLRISRTKSPNYAAGIELEDFTPAVFVYECADCRIKTFATLLVLDDGEAHLGLIPIRSGLSTPNTPKAVAYWLDQARRAEYGGATSLAAAGYRVVIDQILLQQGLAGRMLGNKIQDLVAKVGAGTAPAWSGFFDLDILRDVKGIGDGTLHADDAPLERLETIDSALLRAIEGIIAALLDLIYEEPARRKTLAAKVAAAKAVVKPT